MGQIGQHMRYIVDNNVLIRVSQSRSLWESFELATEASLVVSVREVFGEIMEYQGESSPLRDWAISHRAFFEQPTMEEAECVKKILRVRLFQHLIKRKKLIQGGAAADPFLIAKAKIEKGTLVTLEKYGKTLPRSPTSASG